MDPRGAYPLDRAAALSGVPRSTVTYWARKDILVPSISAERTRLWSYPDLMALRVVYWLRQPKKAHDGAEIPRTKMPAVRRVASQLRALDMDLWSAEEGPPLAVDRNGQVVIDSEAFAGHLDGQTILDADLLPVLRPFETLEGTRGPDLLKPRPHLRIVPGKLGGSPHVERTRLETLALAALARRGVQKERIYRLYPIAPPEGIDQALELEQQLDANLKLAA